MPAVNHFERAYRAWDILVSRATARDEITYKELARELGIHYRPTRYLLEPIQDYCLETQRPPLTILVVDRFGSRGAGFIAWDRGNLSEGREEVFRHPWRTEENPFQFAANGQAYDSLISDLISGRRSARDTYAIVRVRGTAQLMFRTMMMRVYDESCAFSGLRVPMALEAAHILPWSECDAAERLDVRNGLVLSVLHHRLFDGGLIRLNEDYSICVDEKLLQNRDDSPAHETLVEQLHGARMRLPRSQAHWPGLEFIRRKYQS